MENALNNLQFTSFSQDDRFKTEQSKLLEGILDLLKKYEHTIFDHVNSAAKKFYAKRLLELFIEKIGDMIKHIDDNHHIVTTPTAIGQQPNELVMAELPEHEYTGEELQNI